MKSRATLFLLAMLAVQVFAGDVLVVEPMGGSQHGAWVGVDVMEAVQAVRKLATQKQDVYVESLNRPRAGELYADAAEGVSDQLVTAYETKEEISIPKAIAKSVEKNKLAWTVGTASAIGAAIWGYQELSKGSGDSAPPAPTYHIHDVDGDVTIGDDNLHQAEAAAE